MHPKLAQIHTLLDDGFECVDIRSDDQLIEVWLSRGERITRLTLTREDARALLTGPMKESRAARFLIRGPIRR